MDLNDIATRVKTNKPVTPAEFAYLIANDREAFMAFLIANNPGSMNNILRHQLGYTFELGFTPDPAKIQRIVQMILDNNNTKEIQTIAQNFKLNLNGLSPELYQAIHTQFNQ